MISGTEASDDDCERKGSGEEEDNKNEDLLLLIINDDDCFWVEHVNFIHIILCLLVRWIQKRHVVYEFVFSL